MFDEYISRYGKRLFGLCMKLCNNREDAEDLYQETWVKAYRFLGKYDVSKEFEGWLTSICVNAYRDILRRQKWKSLVAWFRTTEEKDFAIESAPDREEDYSDVRDAVEGLPDKYRVATVLYYWSGHDVKRIAEMLSIPEGTVKYRLHKARELLKGVLEPDG